MSLVISKFADAVAFSNAHFGVGTGSIFLDGLGCTGSESSLLDCSKSSSVYCYYGHSEDAGVRCSGKSFTLMLSCMINFQIFTQFHLALVHMEIFVW